MRHSCADLLQVGPNTTRRYPPKEGTTTTRRLVLTASVLPVHGRYGNIDPFIHSTTPVGLALGPDSPGDDERGPGTLGHPADGILTRLSLLMSAFSLPRSPRPVYTGRFAPRRTLSYPATMKIAAASSVVCLSPATLSARNH